MQSFVMMALGAYRFSVYNGGFQESERDTKWRWAEQEVIGAAPALQFIGPGCDSMSIEGVIHPHYRGSLGQIDRMRSQAGLGMPLPLIDGSGRYYGLWVIEKVKESKSVFLPDGAPRKVTFSLDLKRYG